MSPSKKYTQKGNREHESPVRGDPMRPARRQLTEGRLVSDVGKAPSWIEHQAALDEVATLKAKLARAEEALASAGDAIKLAEGAAPESIRFAGLLAFAKMAKNALAELREGTHGRE